LAIDYRLPITDYRLPITHYRLPITDYPLPITDYPLPNMTNSIRVVARIISLPDKVEETKAMLLALVELTRGEAGCLKYELLQNHSDPTDFTFVEEWASTGAFHAHVASAHITAAMDRVPDLIAQGPDIQQYELLA
jgi:quinol monooxygenase YgiN